MSERRSFFMDLSVGESMRLHTGVEIELRSKDGAKAYLAVRIPESVCMPASAVLGNDIVSFFEQRYFPGTSSIPSNGKTKLPKCKAVKTGGRKGRQVGMVLSTSDIVIFPGDVELTTKFKKGQKARFHIKTQPGQDVKKIMSHERTPLQAGHSDALRT